MDTETELKITTEQQTRQWIETTTKEKHLVAVANKIGVAQKTFNNHVKSGGLNVSEIIAICRKYGKSPIEGLEEHGYITEQEIAEVVSNRNTYSTGLITLIENIKKRIEDMNELNQIAVRDDNIMSYRVAATMYHYEMQGRGEDATLIAPESFAEGATVDDDDLEWAASPHEETEIPYAE